MSKKLSVQDNILYFRQRSGWSGVPVWNIIYFESTGRQMKIHCVSRDIVITCPIFLAENLFEKELFIRVHRAYIVGVQHIEELGRTKVRLRNGDILPVGRKYGEKIKKAIKQ